MATVTWLGKSSLHTDINDATDPANWVAGTFPHDGDTIIINAGTVGNAVTLDLIGQPGTTQTITNDTLVIAGPFDTLTNTHVIVTGSTITAGDGPAAGQGFVYNLTDSTVDASALNIGANGTLNLSGSTATALRISSDVSDTIIRQTGSAFVINTTGTANIDGLMWLQTAGAQTTINVAQLGTIAGFYGSKGAILNLGGTLTTNGDSNTGTRFSNNGFMLIDGGQAPALDRFNARMNSISGMIDILGETHGATLDVNTNMSGAQVVNFGDANARLKIETATTLSSVFNVGATPTTVLQNFFSRINGFQAGNTIELVGLDPTGLSYSFGSDPTYGDGVLIINRGTGTVARLRFQSTNFVAGTGTIDNAGATTGNFQLTSSGGDTLVTVSNTRNAIGGGTTVAVSGTLAQWNGITSGVTTDWSALNWSGGTGAGGLPGQFQGAQITLTAAQLAAVVAAASPSAFPQYTMTISTAQTAGAVTMSDPLAVLKLTAPLTLAAPPGQTSGGGFAAHQGKVDIASGGLLDTSRLYVGSGSDLVIEAGGSLAVSGVAGLTLGSGLAGLDIEGSGKVEGGTVASGGNTVIGLNGNANFNVSNNVISNAGTFTTFGTIGASYTTAYTQIGGSVLTGADTPGSFLQISGPNTTYTDAGGDASTPFSGAMIVGGGNISVNGLGQITLPTGGTGQVNVQSGATLTEASFAILGARSGSSGSVNVTGGSRWNIGLGAVTPIGSLVVGNTITTTQTLFSSGLPWLTVGSGGSGTLDIEQSVVQLGTGEAFNTAKMIIGTGNSGNNSATGTVTVQGIGALLDTGGGPLIVGQRSNGFLTVGNGGTVLVGNGGTVAAFGWGLGIGNRAGTVGASSGLVNVNGGGSIFDTGDLMIGRDAAGTLNLTGGNVHATGDLQMGGVHITQNGTVVITTPNLLHGAGPGGTLLVSGGGALTIDGTAANLWQGSTIQLNGGSQIVIGSGTSGVSGELVVAPGATLQGAGVITVTSGDSTLRNFGTVIAGGLLNNGVAGQSGVTLEINAVLAGSGVFALSPNSTLQLDNGNPITARIDFGTTHAGPEFIRVMAPLAFHGTIDNFYGPNPSNDRVDLVGAGFVSPLSLTYSPNPHPTTGGGIAIVTNLGTTTFTVTGYHPNGFGSSVDGANTGTVIFPNDVAPCFVAGTRLLTATGERPVETIRPGDLLPTALGHRLRRVVWAGHTTIDLDRHPDPIKAAPVRIAAHAFGPDQPHRDLVVSPDHAIWTGEALIPAYLLANGRSIAREPAQGRVTYLHIELDGHDLILAEGLASESYLDTGNRGLFAGAEDARPLHPDLTSANQWDERACAPLTLGGPALHQAHRRLAARATTLGYRTTDDPAITIEANGQPIQLLIATQERLAAIVPAGTTRLTLRSRAAIPNETDPARNDRRRLGIAIAAITLDGHDIALDSPACTAGFHAPESDLRWTDGAAALVFPPCQGSSRLELFLRPGLVQYPVRGDFGQEEGRKKALLF